MKRHRIMEKISTLLLARLDRDQPALAQRLRAVLGLIWSYRSPKRPHVATAPLAYEPPLTVTTFYGRGLIVPLSEQAPMICVIYGRHMHPLTIMYVDYNGISIRINDIGSFQYTPWSYDYNGATTNYIRVHGSDQLEQYVMRKFTSDNGICITPVLSSESIEFRISGDSSTSTHNTASCWCSMLRLDIPADAVPFQHDYASYI
jgi:hypothetical protein